MAFNLDNLDTILKLKKNLKNLNIIFIGDHFPTFTKIPENIIKKHNLNPDINEKNEKNQNNREYLKKILKKTGFETISFLDNYNDKNLDYKINLTVDNSTKKIRKKFGIVIDNGTSIYVSNILNALNSIMFLVDDEGYIVTNIDPLSFNRFPFLPAPETLLDYMLSNQFICTSLLLSFYRKNNLSKNKNYPINFKDKHYYIFRSFTFVEFLNYLRFILVNYIFSEKKISDINLEDYYKHKMDNFKKFNKSSNNAQLKENILKSILKKYNLFNFIKKIYNNLKKLLSVDKNVGRVSIDFIFKKDTKIIKNTFNSSTIHYEIRWK